MFCPGSWGFNLLGPMFPLQVLFACAEALHAHGYSTEASRLTVELAQDLLANPPDLKVEPPPAKVRDTPLLYLIDTQLLALCSHDSCK